MGSFKLRALLGSHRCKLFDVLVKQDKFTPSMLFTNQDVKRKEIKTPDYVRYTLMFIEKEKSVDKIL